MRTLLFFVPTGRGFSPNPHKATYPRVRIDFLACEYARTFIIYIPPLGQGALTKEQERPPASPPRGDFLCNGGLLPSGEKQGATI